jgi:small redox-active disulfide protein 2
MESFFNRRLKVKKLQVLGSGCSSCDKLAEITETIAKEMGIEYEIEKVKDINEIIRFGVMMTPALVIDGDVKVTGKVPSAEEIRQMLS